MVVVQFGESDSFAADEFGYVMPGGVECGVGESVGERSFGASQGEPR